MVFRLLADLLVAFHLAFVLFVVLGGVLVIRHPRVAFIHVPVALWGGLIELSGWVCPLTPLEVRFRILGGQAGYTGGFVDHYLIPVLYPPGLTREDQLWLGILVCGLNLGVYGFVLWRRVRGAGEAPPPPSHNS